MKPVPSPPAGHYKERRFKALLDWLHFSDQKSLSKLYAVSSFHQLVKDVSAFFICLKLHCVHQLIANVVSLQWVYRGILTESRSWFEARLMKTLRVTPKPEPKQ